jgi:zinc transporter ZupT
MGFAAGCMIWIVFAELLPDALEDAAAGVQPCIGLSDGAHGCVLQQ